MVKAKTVGIANDEEAQEEILVVESGKVAGIMRYDEARRIR